MNRVQNIAIRLFITSLVLCSCFATATLAQTPTPSPSPSVDVKVDAKPPDKAAQADPFAPEPAGPLPAGMTGSDTGDPRAKLSPGMFDAGEAAVGLKHVLLLKKPDVFQLGSDDPNDPNVQKTLGQMGAPLSEISKLPKQTQLVIAQLAFANSDMAFQGNHLFQGNFYGLNIVDISNPAKAKLLSTIICPGGQNDVSVYKNLLFMSVEQPNGRVDCGAQGFTPPPPAPTPAAEAESKPPLPPAQKDRFRGVRIFDISNITKPKQVAAVQTCRGSHTHTLVTDPNDPKNVYLYVSGTSFVRQADELAGCSGETPDKDPNTSLFRIDVIKVPLASPQDAKVVSSPRLFSDQSKLNALSNGGSHGKDAEKPQDTDQCHDITVYTALGLAAGACSGNGILIDIKDPANPKRLDAVNDPNYAYWHSASFSNDGKKVLFTDEWGGGLGARCRANDPVKWGADAIFNVQDNKLKFANYYKMPAAQADSENCVAHNGSLIPVPGRDIAVQSWYQGGVSIVDFTDSEHPQEIGYFDRGPIYSNMLVLGGHWSSYWYNGYIYASEIARGLDVFELTPTKNLTQNEIDAAKLVRVSELNVQNQQKIEWPRKLVVAKAYIDQLERSQALPADKILSLRQAVEGAEAMKLSATEMAKLRNLAPSLETAARAAGPADTARLLALADIFKRPEH
jgi:hypothetical protein